MKKRLSICLIIALLAASLAVAGELETLTAKVKAHYGEVKDFTTDFAQVTTLRQMGGREKKASGTIYLKRPNKMKWVYKTPTQREIISDGNTLAMYMVEEKKVYLSQTKGPYDITEPMRILSGELEASDRLDSTLLEDEGGRARIKLTPKQAAAYKHLIVHIGRESNLVEIIESEDAYGNITKLTLSNQRFNTGLTDSLFVYVPQEGVEIIDAPMNDF